MLFIEYCSIKVLNALDFLHSVNEKGGIDRMGSSRNSQSFVWYN